MERERRCARKGGVARRVERVVEGLRWSLKRASETSANSDMRERAGGREACSVVRVNVCKKSEEMTERKEKDGRDPSDSP